MVAIDYQDFWDKILSCHILSCHILSCHVSNRTSSNEALINIWLICYRYDSLTGVPSSQRTVAFEKASVLFNVGALYTQIGTRQDRSSSKGLDSAVDNFLRSAGTFQYILENFTNAPSMDLSPGTLEFLVHLMCAQARECLLEKGELALNVNKSIEVDDCLVLGQEAAHVSVFLFDFTHRWTAFPKKSV